MLNWSRMAMNHRYHLSHYLQLGGRNPFAMAYASSIPSSSSSSSSSSSASNIAPISLTGQTLPFSSTSNDLYVPIPDHYTLEKVIVIHRHGDRTPIERTAGPHFPEKKFMTGVWSSTLPSIQTLKRIERVGKVVHHSIHDHQYLEQTEVYSGWDQNQIPYGQLTELGAQQLIRLGEKLRHRYQRKNLLSFDLEQTEQELFCRSTYICRTVHSIRSLLVGLYNITAPTEKEEEQFQKEENIAKPSSYPTIHTRSKLEETLYPQVDGRCPRILERRVTIEPLLHLPYYEELSHKVRRIFGYTEKAIPWINLQEILNCHATHDLLHLFPEIQQTDIDQIGKILAEIWGILYRDPEMARYGLGRFITELLADIEERPHAHHEQVMKSFYDLSTHHSDVITKNKKLLIYSAHDSTIIPILCMLKHFNDKWPVYAANIVIEIAVDRNENDSRKFVRILYNDEALTYPRSDHSSTELVEWISYDSFKDLLSQYQISQEEYRRACGLSTSPSPKDVEHAPQSSPPLIPTLKSN